MLAEGFLFLKLLRFTCIAMWSIGSITVQCNIHDIKVQQLPWLQCNLCLLHWNWSLMIPALCGSMVNDIKTAKSMIRKGIRSIFTVRYEDIVDDVIKTAESLYRWVWQITVPGGNISVFLSRLPCSFISCCPAMSLQRRISCVKPEAHWRRNRRIPRGG